MKKENLKKHILTALISAACGCLLTGAVITIKNKEKLELAEKYAVLDECRNIISENGDPDFDDEKAYKGMLNGFLNEGGDPYTYYLEDENADKVEEMKKYVNNSGTALASGFSIDRHKSGNILLTEVKIGMAAEKWGLRKGDIITEIGGESVTEAGFENIANKLMGKQDTSVLLKVERDGELLEIEFVRDNEYAREVKWELLSDKVMYIAIESFGDVTDGYVSKALEELKDAESCIIDLRDCPGGDGDTAVSSADFFVDEGFVVKDYFGRSSETITLKSGKSFDGKIVVLTNEATISASEMFTAILRQYGEDVTLIGAKTFGKGIFQQSESLSDGGRLNYTAGYYKVGEWENFHGKGIEPDLNVPMDSALIGTDEDVQLEKALEFLNDNLN